MYTLEEIKQQAEQMERTFDVVEKLNLAKLTSDNVIFTGCGTSYYLAIAAARFFQAKTGISSQAVPASDLFLHPEMIISPNNQYTLFSISRSGTTTEISIALETIQKYENVKKIAITCNDNTPIQQMSDQSIVLEHISEKSVVMTQSFTNMLFAIQCYAAFAYRLNIESYEQLVNELKKEVSNHDENVQKIASNKELKQFIFLGSGSYSGIAKEATLKLKEMTQTVCESYSSLEFRHGPISIVDDHTCVILLSQKSANSYESSLVAHIQQFGGKVVVIGENASSLNGDYTIELPSGFTDWERLTLYMPALQLLAYYRAIALGLNPDQPKNLTQVVKL